MADVTVHIVVLLVVSAIIADASPLLSALVPQIQQENYKLSSEGNQYRLRVTHPNGSTQAVLAQLKDKGDNESAELVVNGIIDTVFDDIEKRVVVEFTAGKNGNVARFRYEPVLLIANKISAQALKTLV